MTVIGTNNKNFIPHDADASNDIRMTRLQRDLGYEAIGITWALKEKLRREQGRYFYEADADILALQLYIPDKADIIKKIISDYDLFKTKEVDGTKVFHSPELDESMAQMEQARQQKIEAGRLGGLASAASRAASNDNSSGAEAVPEQSSSEPQANKVKGKEEKEREVNSKEFNLKEGKESETVSPSDQSSEIIDYLIIKAGANNSIDKDLDYQLISDRLSEGYTVEQLKEVIDKKVAEWKDVETMFRYLRPQTLFRAENFEKYLKEPKPKYKPGSFTTSEATELQYDEIAAKSRMKDEDAAAYSQLTSLKDKKRYMDSFKARYITENGKW